MGQLWEKVENKLNKSGRKWKESEYMSYRCAELFCENAVKVWVYKILYAPICEHLCTVMIVLNRMYDKYHII